MTTPGDSEVMHTIHTAENISWPWHFGRVWCGFALITFGLMVRDTHAHNGTHTNMIKALTCLPVLELFGAKFPPFCSSLPIHIAVMTSVIPAMLSQTHKVRHPHMDVITIWSPFPLTEYIIPLPHSDRDKFYSDCSSSHCYGKWGCKFTFTHSITLMDFVGQQVDILQFKAQEVFLEYCREMDSGWASKMLKSAEICSESPQTLQTGDGLLGRSESALAKLQQ